MGKKGEFSSRIRKCTCGCDTFEVACVEYGSMKISATEDDEITYWSEDWYESDFEGKFVCEKCGKEYNDLHDIPISKARKEAIDAV